MQPNIDIGDVLRKGFDLYKENVTTLLVATLLAYVIAVVTVGILAGPMAAGLVLVTLGLIDKRQPKPDIGEIFQGFTYFVPTLVFVILMIVAMLVGNFILALVPLLGLILPTLYVLALSTFTMFAVFNIVDRKLDVVPAIQASVDTVKANFWIFFGLNIVASVISSIGVVACGVGVIVTAPMYMCMIAVVYRQLQPAAAPAA